MSIVKIENITKKYNEGTVALSNFSLAIEEKEFVAIMGPSGAGKSTLFNLIAALDNPTEGKIYVKDKEVNGLDDKAASKYRMKTIGFVFQNYLLNSKLSAKDNIVMAMLINREIESSEYNERAEQLLDKFGILDCKDKLPKQMSGGEQQRVAIARALANEPEIILADEPTGNLDEENEKNIFTYLKELNQNGKTVIVISHNDIVKEYADRVINIKK